jgi:hypothetical protein
MRRSSLFTAQEITSLMASTKDDFEDETNKMSITDLDLTQRTIEAEIRVLKVYIDQHHGLDQNEYIVIITIFYNLCLPH